MPSRLFGVLVGVLVGMIGVVMVVHRAEACDLRLEPSPTFGGSCQVLVGYYNGQRVGPFHISLPDGSQVTAGSCEGFVGVRSVNANVVDLEAFHAVRPRQYTLALDCRSSVLTR
jgi:hypothetical protein